MRSAKELAEIYSGITSPFRIDGNDYNLKVVGYTDTNKEGCPKWLSSESKLVVEVGESDLLGVKSVDLEGFIAMKPILSTTKVFEVSPVCMKVDGSFFDVNHYGEYPPEEPTPEEPTPDEPTPDEPTPDVVNKPPHYTYGGSEVIDIIRDATINSIGSEGFLHGNVIKYILRYPYKNGIEDLKKARVYLDWLIEELEGTQV